MFSFESPHRGNSNEYTQFTIFNIKKENHPKSSQICIYGIFSKVLKDQFQVALAIIVRSTEDLLYVSLIYHFREIHKNKVDQECARQQRRSWCEKETGTRYCFCLYTSDNIYVAALFKQH